MTPDMIKGIAIGVCIGFIIPIVIYLFLKRMEYKPERRGVPRFKNPPPPPPKPKKDMIENHPIISRHYSIIDSELKPSPKCSNQNPESESHVN